MNRGYFAIGIEYPKYKENYGSLYRTALIFGASFVFVIGGRYKPQKQDTMKSYKHIPSFSFDCIEDLIKINTHARIVGIELVDNAGQLIKYWHRDQSIYILGSESIGLSSNTINKCDDIIKLPGDVSLNVSVAGSIVLYDRYIKRYK